jgi:hypothetical protein
MWELVVAAAYKGATSYNNAKLGNALGVSSDRIAEANRQTEVVNVAAANQVRGGKNTLTAAELSLAAAKQSIESRRNVEAAGANYEAFLEAASRQQDQLASASFEEQIASAEQAGQATAKAGFHGAVGSAPEQIASATALRAYRSKQSMLTAQGTQEAGINTAAQSLFGNLLAAPNYSMTLAQLDYAKNTVSSFEKTTPQMSETSAAFAGAAESIVSNWGAWSNAIGAKPKSKAPASENWWD